MYPRDRARRRSPGEVTDAVRQPRSRTTTIDELDVIGMTCDVLGRSTVESIPSFRPIGRAARRPDQRLHTHTAPAPPPERRRTDECEEKAASFHDGSGDPVGARRRCRRLRGVGRAAGAGAPAPVRATSTPSGGTPCVAAHSTTRALYGAYNGPLYQVRRASDNTTRDIGVLSAGGYANAAAQDSFCASTTCLITIIYDQSGRNNHLTQAPAGGWPGPAPGGCDNLAEREGGADHGRRPQGLRRLRRSRHRLPQQQHQRHRDRRPARGHVRRSSTARTTTSGCCFDYGNAETQQPATTATAHGGHLLRQHQGRGATAPATAPGSWPTWRTACSPG